LSHVQTLECIGALFFVLMGFPMLMFWQTLRPPSWLRYGLEWSAFFGAAFAVFGIILVGSWRGAFALLIGPFVGAVVTARGFIRGWWTRSNGDASQSKSPQTPER
jgi:hypothetical protein